MSVIAVVLVTVITLVIFAGSTLITVRIQVIVTAITLVTVIASKGKSGSICKGNSNSEN